MSKALYIPTYNEEFGLEGECEGTMKVGAVWTIIHEAPLVSFRVVHFRALKAFTI